MRIRYVPGSERPWAVEMAVVEGPRTRYLAGEFDPEEVVELFSASPRWVALLLWARANPLLWGYPDAQERTLFAGVEAGA